MISIKIQANAVDHNTILLAAPNHKYFTIQEHAEIWPEHSSYSSLSQVKPDIPSKKDIDFLQRFLIS